MGIAIQVRQMCKNSETKPHLHQHKHARCRCQRCHVQFHTPKEKTKPCMRSTTKKSRSQKRSVQYQWSRGPGPRGAIPSRATASILSTKYSNANISLYSTTVSFPTNPELSYNNSTDSSITVNSTTINSGIQT